MPLPFDPIAAAHDNWSKHGWGAEDAMAAATSITRAHQIVLARINGSLEPLGLTFSRFEALALLSFSRKGSLPMGKIGERLQVHPTSVTNTIDRLERDGLVIRVPHPHDRRATLAEITPEGRVLAEKAAGALAKVSFGVGGLDRAAARDVTAVLTGLRRDAGDF